MFNACSASWVRKKIDKNVSEIYAQWGSGEARN